MILNRIASGIKNQDWFVVFVELMIVVVGIYVGLQVDDWQKEREQKAIAETYVSQLITEMETIRDIHRERIKYVRKVMVYAEAALATLEAEKPSLDSQLLVNLYQASNSWSYGLIKTTYDDLVAFGLANAIPDPELRSMVANFYNNNESGLIHLGAEPPYRERIRAYMPLDVQRAIRGTCRDRAVADAKGRLVIKLWENCEIEFDRETLVDAFQSLNNYETLREDLTRKISDMDLKIQVMTGISVTADQMIAQLEEARQ